MPNKATVTAQALESLHNLRNGLHDSATAALTAKDLYMHGVLTELLAVVSKKVSKTQARMAREQVASHRKQHKSLRLQARDVSETSE